MTGGWLWLDSWLWGLSVIRRDALFGFELDVETSLRRNGIINFSCSVADLNCFCPVALGYCFYCRSKIWITKWHNNRVLGDGGKTVVT